LENCFIDFVLLLMGPGILCAHQGNVTARAAVMRGSLHCSSSLSLSVAECHGENARKTQSLFCRSPHPLGKLNYDWRHANLLTVNHALKLIHHRLLFCLENLQPLFEIPNRVFYENGGSFFVEID
jgi:hypothetical protein